MRLKQDFVTNSSTTSFVVWGVSYNHYDFKEENKEKLKEAYIEKYGPVEDDEDDDEYFYEGVDLLLQNTDLEYAIFYDGDWMGVGMPFTKMKDEETFGEFKQRVKTELQKIGITDEPAYIEEAWRDG